MKSKKCKVTVRTIEGDRVPCDVEYKGEVCPEAGDHLNSLKHGYCYSGWHEGTKAVDWRGNPAPTCKAWENCPCFCHDTISQMFALSGMERIPVDMSAYKVDLSEFKLPSVQELAEEAAILAARSNGSGSGDLVRIESPAPGIVPPLVTRSYTPTASGRAGRGELETWVNTVCAIWIVEKYEWYCTPRYISEAIGDNEGIAPPSTGAVTACLERWAKLGYAEIGKKPTRFIRFTERGIQMGLEGLKEEERRKKASARSKQERGIR